MNILILGGGLQGLCCGASLYNKEYNVDIVSSDLQILKSKFFGRIYSETCSHNEELYCLLGNNHYDVLIPMGDANVSFLSKNKHLIEEKYGCKCACPDFNVLSIVEDKHLFMSFCEKNEIPHPKTIALSHKNIENCSSIIGFPSLIKPDFSVGARVITKVANINELNKQYPLISKQYGACTLQEYIDNREFYYNVMLYRDNNGRFLAHSIIKIVRMYPVHAGSSTCCITVDNENLLNICKACLDKLGWVGMADFDVLQRLDNEEYKIIEINARVPASLKGAMISGVNFPEIIVRDSLKLEISRYPYTPGKVMRYLGTDLMWFLKSPKRFKAEPNWFSFIGQNIFYQDIYKEDSSTWWTWFAEGIKKLKRRNKNLR